MRHQAQNREDHDTFLLALGQLSAAGIDVDWTARCQPATSRDWFRFPVIPLSANGIGSNTTRCRLGGGAPATNGMADGTCRSGDTLRPRNGKSPMETTLQRIWAQCLGVGSIDRNANFFELGGDSLVAISVAMTAANEGLDLTPQDLYENQKRRSARQGSGCPIRRGRSGAAVTERAWSIRPVPPNIAHFLEHGLRDAGRWRIPVILQLRPDVEVEDVRAVLTAVTNHHDALRLRIVQRAGTWEQHVGEPQELTELATRSLPDGLASGSPQEREAVIGILERADP